MSAFSVCVMLFRLKMLILRQKKQITTLTLWCETWRRYKYADLHLLTFLLRPDRLRGYEQCVVARVLGILCTAETPSGVCGCNTISFEGGASGKVKSRTRAWSVWTASWDWRRRSGSCYRSSCSGIRSLGPAVCSAPGSGRPCAWPPTAAPPRRAWSRG